VIFLAFSHRTSGQKRISIQLGSIMSSQHRSPWHVDVFRTLTRFNLPKQLPRRPSVPKSWTFLPRQWPPNIPGLGINMNLLQTSSSSAVDELSRRYSQPSTSSYDSCMSTVDPGRPSFDHMTNYGAQPRDFDDDTSSCSSSSYSELISLLIYENCSRHVPVLCEAKVLKRSDG